MDIDTKMVQGQKWKQQQTIGTDNVEHAMLLQHSVEKPQSTDFTVILDRGRVSSEKV